MQPEDLGIVLVCLGNNVHCSSREINRRSADDSDLNQNVLTIDDRTRNGRSVVLIPEKRAGICVEGENGIRCRRYIDNVVRPPCDGQVRYVKRLRKDISIYLSAEYLSESSHIDVKGRQHGFIQIYAGSGVIVVLCENAYLGGNRLAQKRDP